MKKCKRKQRYYILQDMHELAAQHGGKCKATEFRTGEEKLGWICALGHKWEAVPKSILKGHWCLVCGRETSGVRDCRQTTEEGGVTTKNFNRTVYVL